VHTAVNPTNNKITIDCPYEFDIETTGINHLQIVTIDLNFFHVTAFLNHIETSDRDHIFRNNQMKNYPLDDLFLQICNFEYKQENF
jgi:hypothetical protein